MEALSSILKRKGSMGPIFERPDLLALARMRVDNYNALTGEQDKIDGYDCALCKNKGIVMYLKEDNGVGQEWSRPCRCMKTRATIRRMRRSGLGNVIRDKTFDRYIATEPWQQRIKDAAVAYANAPSGWFYLGGQPGSGKSHLGAAICRHFLLAGREVVYMSWLDDVAQLKSQKNDAGYGELIGRYKAAEVLYIDDLFKAEERDGVRQLPTGADIRLAFEILTYRYNDPALLTIVSSEYYAGQLLDIDEAVGSRIIETAGANIVNIGRDRSRNYRLKGVTVL